ncbi:MFS transporter, partial [Aquibium sp. A9E412]|nr:MFS transporter [Aquibium sp. A9E412]
AALGAAAGAREPPAAPRWRALFRGPAVALHAIALSFGATSAIYISFAADRVAQASGLAGLPAEASSAIVFVGYGTFGLLGLATGRAKAVAGLPGLLRGLLAASALSLALVAAVPASWPGVVLSAGLQGVYVMMTSAVLAFWSERLFPTLPSFSFTAALLAVGVGNVAGPVAAGLISDAVGSGTMFFGAAAISAATAIAVRPRHVQERPAGAWPGAGAHTNN